MRVMLSSCVCLSVRPPDCLSLSQADIVSKRLDKSSWHGGFLRGCLVQVGQL